MPGFLPHLISHLLIVFLTFLSDIVAELIRDKSIALYAIKM